MRDVREKNEVRELAATLGRVPLLASLDRRTLERLANHATIRTYAPDEPIVREGDAGVALYIVLRGRARVERQADGDTRDLGTVRGGDFFGELALIEEHGRTASVTALDETECVVLPAWEFKALLDEHPRMARVIMEALIARMHRAEHG